MGSRHKAGCDGDRGSAYARTLHLHRRLHARKRRHGTIYVGVTSDLNVRGQQHREGSFPGFTKTYGVKRLVWYEQHETMTAAIQREKSLKKYGREWKINLIEETNPNWEDLYDSMT